MNPKIIGILAALKDEHKIESKKLNENNFELITFFSKWNHRTFFNIEITGDILRTEIRHVLASLENIDSDLLFYLLTNNYESLWNSSSYAAIKVVEKDAYLSLNSYQHFKLGWADKDIAEIIFMVINDITMVLLHDNGAPEGIVIFGK